ncbi:MAG: molybdopterin molybdotransferase MoeA [Sulfurimonas sp.]|jgi:molybdopterin molybdotransferase|nr:molybdopterin molybdotransferase MoeA [Sulfurimonadaceae bacterium]
MSLLSYDASQDMLELLDVGVIKHERVPLTLSLGRVLATDIVADENEPKFLTASMDGYAIKFEDQVLKTIKVLGDNPAGNDANMSIDSGESIKTFTGSKMPIGADTLIPIELVSFENDTITINEEVAKGYATRAVAESFAKGDVLISKGTKIGFVEVGVMASLNVVMVDVVLKPRVSIISTGSEILDLGECSQNEAKIRSSNNYTLAALIEQAGAASVQLGTTTDDKDEIYEAFLNALNSSDIIITTGGVSVGDYDFVKDVVLKLGAEVLFKGVAIKPGKHILVAKKGTKFIFSLPGFAYSSTITAILYVLPIVAKMLGKNRAYKTIEAKLSEEFKKRSNLSEFSACNLVLESGAYEVNFDGKKVGSSAILTNMLNGSAILKTSPEDGDLEAGTMVSVIVLDV